LERGARVERQIGAQELELPYDMGMLDRSHRTVDLGCFRHYTRLEREQERYGQDDWVDWEEQQEAHRRGQVEL
jgi:hypothetical protein